MFIGFNVIGILACLLSCVNTYITVIIGRFIYGITGGIMLSLTPKMLLETIPQDIYNKGYGASTSFVIHAFTMFDMFLGVALFHGFGKNGEPLIHGNPTFWYRWRVLYAIPIPFMILAIIIFVTFVNKETIEYYVK